MPITHLRKIYNSGKDITLSYMRPGQDVDCMEYTVTYDFNKSFRRNKDRVVREINIYRGLGNVV